jgi:hypothetical protein
MSKQQRGERREDAAPERESSAFESGVIAKVQRDEGRQPPWDIVLAYLERGEHQHWVEAWAARTPAFRDVLDALRNDHEERASARRRATSNKRRR